ncbi:MAG: ATP-dependent DNA helicase [Acidimicrobiia bacterium]
MTETLDFLARVVTTVGGESRPGQADLARAIADAITERTHLLAEAGTGSGKSFAYLVPALLSGSKVVVATATKTLQDQLWRKDIPTVMAALDRKVSVAILKGRSNYLCRALLDAALDDTVLFSSRPSATFPDDAVALSEWAQRTATGDEADLDVEVAMGSWRALTCSPGECPGANRCHRGSSCFAEDARARAEAADLLVVNTSLYCAHIASGGYVLPPHDVVIFDEAHELADIATRAFGIDLGPGRLRFLASRGRSLVGAAPADAVARAADSLERALTAYRDQEAEIDPTLDPLRNVLVQCGEATSALLREAREDAAATGDTGRLQLMQMLSAALDDVRRVATPESSDVVWAGGSPVALHSAPIEVGDRLGRAVFDRVPVICVSATLGSGERFEPFARAIGLDPGAVHQNEGDPGLAYTAHRFVSPFDYRANGRLYVAAHLPDPRTPEWAAAAAEELCSLVQASRGHALVLCTSHAGARAGADALRTLSNITVLAQGDQPKAQLIDAFRSDPSSVLVATRSFWQGVDVPGGACVLVVIDKLPFSRPDDPLERARRARVEQHGGASFFEVDIPRAALTLAQGAGRLLRTASDRGVVAVLDPRLATARYRSALLRALPPFARTIRRDEVEAFLRDIVDTTELA